MIHREVSKPDIGSCNRKHRNIVSRAQNPSTVKVGLTDRVQARVALTDNVQLLGYRNRGGDCVGAGR
ncbi:MAG: hypothetical protein ACYSYU_11735 [Planctomycetota bacterium]